MLATVWRWSRTRPMLGASVRVGGRPPLRLVAGVAGGDVRGWLERGIGRNSVAGGAASDTISEAFPTHNPITPVREAR